MHIRIFVSLSCPTSICVIDVASKVTQIPELVAKKDDILRKLRQRTILFHILIFVPIIIFWATIIASLERTPLTGR